MIHWFYFFPSLLPIRWWVRHAASQKNNTEKRRFTLLLKNYIPIIIGPISKIRLWVLLDIITTDAFKKYKITILSIVVPEKKLEELKIEF